MNGRIESTAYKSLCIERQHYFALYHDTGMKIEYTINPKTLTGQPTTTYAQMVILGQKVDNEA